MSKEGWIERAFRSLGKVVTWRIADRKSVV